MTSYSEANQSISVDKEETLYPLALQLKLSKLSGIVGIPYSRLEGHA